MNLNDIINQSFRINISNKIPGLILEDLIKNDLPNTLQYIILKEDECEPSRGFPKIKARNHPRIREIQKLVYYDKKLNELPQGSYNYLIFKDTFTDKFHIAFGLVTSKLELGVKHTIMSKGFPIYLSGEIIKYTRTDLNGIKYPKFKFNFNSSNFSIKKIRSKSFIALQGKDNDPLNYKQIYKLDINIDEKTPGMSQEQIEKLEKAMHQFYLDFIEPFARNIFQTISGYEPNEKYELEFTVAEQDVYSIYKNKSYYNGGLHPYYYEEKKNCYYDTNVNLIKRINEKGLGDVRQILPLKESKKSEIIDRERDREDILSRSYSNRDELVKERKLTNVTEGSSRGRPREETYTVPNTEISRMCVFKVIPGVPDERYYNCKQDTTENTIDVLDELFLQLLYQRDKIRNRPYLDFWLDDDESFIVHNIVQSITDANLNYTINLQDNNNDKNKVLKYFEIWFPRYVKKNGLNYDTITKYINNNNNQKYNSIDKSILNKDDINILQQQLLIIKIILYITLRLRLFVDLEECVFYDTGTIVDNKYKINYKGQTINLRLISKFVFDFPLTELLYDLDNTGLIYTGNIFPTNEYNTIDTCISYLTSIYVPTTFEFVNIINIDEIINKLPIPIDYLSFKSKYLKYKAKYLQLKKLNK